jgi:hypothetical protein
MPSDEMNEADATPPVEKPRKRRWGRRIALAVGIVLVLLAVLVLVVPLVLPESLVGRITAGVIRSKIGREATVEGARVSVFSGFTARGIRVERREGFGDGPLATVGSVSARLDYEALLRGTIRVAQVQVGEVEAHVIRDARGTLNVQDILDLPPSGIQIGRVAARAVAVHLNDQQRGLSESVRIASADVSAVHNDKRSIETQVALGSGGTASVSGEAEMDAKTGELAAVALRVQAGGIAVGRLATQFLKGRVREGTDLSAVEPILVDADLHLGGTTDRSFVGKGTVTVREFPRVPELALEAPERAVTLSLDGKGSPDDFEADLELTTMPGKVLHATLHADDRHRKEGAGAFELENFFVDALLELRADLQQRGLPGTPIQSGTLDLTATAKGRSTQLEATLKSALKNATTASADGPVAVPDVALETEATAQMNEQGVTVNARRYALTTKGATISGDATLHAPPDAEKVAVTVSNDSAIDFAALPPSLVDLLRMPVEGGTLAGTLAAKLKADVTVKTVQTPQGVSLQPGAITATGSADLKQFAVQGGSRSVPPSDLAARFNVVADTEALSARFTDTTIEGSGVKGSLDGSVTLATESEASRIQGDLKVDLVEVVRRYGVLLGVPSGLDVKGSVAWTLDAQQQGEELTARGDAAVTDLALGGEAWRGEPLQEAKAQLEHHVVWNRKTGIIDCKSLLADARGIHAEASGALALPGSQEPSALTVSLKADTARLRELRGFLPPQLAALSTGGQAAADLNLSGKSDDLAAKGTVAWTDAQVKLGEAQARGTLRYDIAASLKGTPGDGVVDTSGSGTLQDAVIVLAGAPSEPFRDPKLALEHDVELDLGKRIASIRKLSVDAQRLTASASGRLVVPGPVPPGGEITDRTSLDVKATADAALVDAIRTYLPAEARDLRLQGTVTTDLTVKETDEPKSPYQVRATIGWPKATVDVADVKASADVGYQVDATLNLVDSVYGAAGTLELKKLTLAAPKHGLAEFQEESLTLEHDVQSGGEGGTVTLRKLAATSKRYDFTASGSLSLPKEGAEADAAPSLDLKLAGQAGTELVALAPLPEQLNDLKLAGAASFDLQASGTLTRPQVTGWIDGRAVSITFKDLLNKPADVAARLDLDAALTEKRLDVRKAEAQLGGLRAALRLQAATDLSSLDGRLEAPDLALAELAKLSPLAARYKPDGQVAVQATVSGSKDAPKLNGAVTLGECSAQLPGDPKLRPVLSGQLTAAETDVALNGLTLSVDGQSVRLDGTARNATAYPKTEVSLTLAADKLDLDRILAAVQGEAPAAPEPQPPAPPATGWQIGPVETRKESDQRPPGQLPPGTQEKPGSVTIPRLPPELKAVVTGEIAEVVYDKRSVKEIRLDAALEKSVLTLKQFAAKPLGGSLTASGQATLGEEPQHALTIAFADVAVDQDFEPLRKFPLFNVLVATLGGMPDRISFVANLEETTFSARGLDLETLKQTVTGKGQATLRNLHLAGSPLFELLAAYTQRKELGDLRFERSDIPFTLGGGVLQNTATLPYQEGAFFVEGRADLGGPIQYDMKVRNPEGMPALPSKLNDYLKGGNAIIYIRGTAAEPKPRIPTEDIAAYLLRRKLLDKLRD